MKVHSRGGLEIAYEKLLLVDVNFYSGVAPHPLDFCQPLELCFGTNYDLFLGYGTQRGSAYSHFFQEVCSVAPTHTLPLVLYSYRRVSTGLASAAFLN
ncbi:hypothetical protein SAMN05421823_11812 [Catalinimonas alkaloidigena]|uniref:Uncharacterized protein n=1 Tax=Catalinimonas alkaloidigena TaxID=1075417 RepID=A0A1G9UWV2_9BACT|nr:hypothetical protein SAMN05421823_11812 [Catalinimonas alkaloidigena]